MIKSNPLLQTENILNSNILDGRYFMWMGNKFYFGEHRKIYKADDNLDVGSYEIKSDDTTGINIHFSPKSSKLEGVMKITPIFIPNSATTLDQCIVFIDEPNL